MNTAETGRQAEAAAEYFLAQQGFSLLQRNFRTRTGEIDLIMTKGNLAIFVEVRYRANPQFGTGAESVSVSKQRKIIRTAQMFLQKHPNIWEQYRFDVVSIGTSIDWIPGAFTLD